MWLLLNRGQAHDNTEPGITQITHKHMKKTGRFWSPWGSIFTRGSTGHIRVVYICVCVQLSVNVFPCCMNVFMLFVERAVKDIQKCACSNVDIFVQIHTHIYMYKPAYLYVIHIAFSELPFLILCVSICVQCCVLVRNWDCNKNPKIPRERNTAHTHTLG